MENSSLLLTALFDPDHLIIFSKMLLAMVLGSIIGLERELKRKPVGVKLAPLLPLPLVC